MISFFLVSTEMTGQPCSKNFWVCALICSNCALRSGLSLPSRVLALPWRLYPIGWSRPATFRSPMRKPCRCNSCASLRVLLHVQRKGDSGSPRVVGPTNASTAWQSWGSVRGFRPPPDSPPFQRFPRTALQLTHPRMDRAPRQARGWRDQRHPAMRQRLRFRRRPEPPLPFVQHPPQRLVFLANPPYEFLLSHAKSLSYLFSMCKLFVRSS